MGFCQRPSVLNPADLNKHLIIHENVIYYILYNVFDESPFSRLTQKD